MAITQNPAATVKAGIDSSKTYSNIVITKVSTKRVGELNHIFAQGAHYATLTFNEGKQYDVEGIILEAGSFTPPAYGANVTFNSDACIVTDASVDESDTGEAMLKLTLITFDDSTYAAPA